MRNPKFDSTKSLTTMFENNEQTSSPSRVNNSPARMDAAKETPLIDGIATPNKFDMLAIDDDQHEDLAQAHNETPKSSKKSALSTHLRVQRNQCDCYLINN